jgi:hypothetical protein
MKHSKSIGGYLCIFSAFAAVLGGILMLRSCQRPSAPAAGSPADTETPQAGFSLEPETAPQKSPAPSASAKPRASHPSIVYVAPISGEKYHKRDCSAIRDTTIIALAHSQAEALDYEPCKLCKPFDSAQ